MRQRSLRLSLILLWAALVQCRATEPVVLVKLLVPLAPFQIATVRLGGQVCKLVASRPSTDARIVVVLLVNSLSREVENDEFEELRSFLSWVRPDKSVEVWSSIGTGNNEIAAAFPTGWVSTLRSGPLGKSTHDGRNLTSDHAEVLELVARRFAGRGPVRLFLVDSFFSVDMRQLGSYDGLRYNETAIEPFWPLIGDSGLNVYPVIVTTRTKRPPRPQTHRTYSSSLFGTQELIAGGKPGSTLGQAFAQSERGTVITIEVPAKRYTRFRRAPKLQIYSRDGKRQFDRPFVAGGEPTSEAEATAAMAKALSRVVEPLIVGSADVVTSCGGTAVPMSTSSADRFIRLDGVSLPASQPESSRVWVTTRPSGMDRRVLTERGRDTELRRQGSSACVGPLAILGNSEVSIYHPSFRWLANVRVGKVP